MISLISQERPLTPSRIKTGALTYREIKAGISCLKLASLLAMKSVKDKEATPSALFFDKGSSSNGLEAILEKDLC